MAALAFRPLTEADLPLLHEWLQREHVDRWWHERGTLQETVDRYLPSIAGDEPTELYAILLDGRDVGLIQTYRVADYPEWESVLAVGPGVAGIDLFIAEEALTGHGLGTEVIRRFVHDVVFARLDLTACVADPESANVASLRAFEKAGFRRVKEFVDPEEGTSNVLVRFDRPQSAPGYDEPL